MGNAERCAKGGNGFGLGGAFRSQPMIDRGGDERMGQATQGHGAIKGDQQAGGIAAAGNGDEKPAGAGQSVKKSCGCILGRWGVVHGRGGRADAGQQRRRFCSLATLDTTAREAFG